MSQELRVESPKPDVTVAASRSASVVRLDASYLPASEGKAASAAVAAVRAAFPQEGCVGAAHARWGKGFVVAAQAHSGWAQAGYSAVPMADDLIPADHSAVPMADDLLSAGYSTAPTPAHPLPPA